MRRTRFAQREGRFSRVLHAAKNWSGRLLVSSLMIAPAIAQVKCGDSSPASDPVPTEIVMEEKCRTVEFLLNCDEAGRTWEGGNCDVGNVSLCGDDNYRSPILRGEGGWVAVNLTDLTTLTKLVVTLFGKKDDFRCGGGIRVQVDEVVSPGYIQQASRYCDPVTLTLEGNDLKSPATLQNIGEEGTIKIKFTNLNSIHQCGEFVSKIVATFCYMEAQE